MTDSICIITSQSNTPSPPSFKIKKTHHSTFQMSKLVDNNVIPFKNNRKNKKKLTIFCDI